MNCIRCGSELPKGATICSRCGCKNEIVEHNRMKEISIFIMTVISEFLILQNLLFVLDDVKEYIKDIFKNAEFSFSSEMSLLFAIGLAISVVIMIIYIIMFLKNNNKNIDYSKRNNETIIGTGIVLIAYCIAEKIKYGRYETVMPVYAIILFVALPIILSICARIWLIITRKRG